MHYNNVLLCLISMLLGSRRGIGEEAREGIREGAGRGGGIGALGCGGISGGICGIGARGGGGVGGGRIMGM